ncbi:MBL fold metallo-hydrolase [Streptomyces calidiresistens]|uniref:MBL fold metallo-hydrolase n=1 Tax=Streptomyces calidiresistens TaxID=1485586 RepID=A0A7W3T0S4_9ACTN|nr:MBL fold metallo-hydrolase [Streptomyces calidiresistens]MBB0228798.1 MBL fold metallo-hydrolase [Streptomyces calidiresistens]
MAITDPNDTPGDTPSVRGTGPGAPAEGREHAPGEGAGPAGEDGWERVAPGVLRRRLPGWDATVGLVVGPTAAVLVDTGSTPSEGAAVRRSAERVAGVPVRHVLITHPHFDHLLGLGGLPDTVPVAAAGTRALLSGDVPAAGVPADPAGLVADAVRHGLDPDSARAAGEALTAGRWEWREVPPAGNAASIPTLDLPAETHPAGRRVVAVGLGPAHTHHDLALLVTGAPGIPPVVFCGDVVEESGEPQAGPDAHPAGWPGAIDRLLRVAGEGARYVPGHGAVVNAAFLRSQRAALAGRFAASTEG